MVVESSRLPPVLEPSEGGEAVQWRSYHCNAVGTVHGTVCRYPSPAFSILSSGIHISVCLLIIRRGAAASPQFQALVMVSVRLSYK